MNDFLQQESLVLKFKKNGNELSKQKKNGNNEVALYFVRYVQLFFKILKKKKKKKKKYRDTFNFTPDVSNCNWYIISHFNLYSDLMIFHHTINSLCWDL